MKMRVAVPAAFVAVLAGCATGGGGASPAPAPADLPELADLTTFAAPRDSRPTVMVIDFEFAAVSADLNSDDASSLAALVSAMRGQDVTTDRQRSEANLGAGIAQLAIQKMLDAGQFRILERKALDQLLEEQDLAASDRASAQEATIVEQARLLGAEYMLTGAITKLGFEENTKGLGLGGLGIPGVGGIGKKSQKTHVVLTARLVDTSTGEIVANVSGEGLSTKGGGFALAGAGAAGGLALGSGTSNVKETAIGEATDAAVHRLVSAMAERWAAGM